MLFVCLLLCYVCFVQQKAAYEVRISDWSSDVCSSDLTRFYLTGASTNQRIPGEVSKDTALNSPRSANPEWVRQDQQRNVDSIRFANKTIVRLDQTRVEFGAFSNWRHVDRSEEHTSELQSLMRISYAVFCLKKNTLLVITITPNVE